MKTSVTYTLNVLFTLFIFTPFVYNQTSSKMECKNATEKTMTTKTSSDTFTEYVY